MFGVGGKAKILSCRLPLLPLLIKKAHLTDYLIGVDQKIPDWLIKMTFLDKIETVIRSWALAQVTPFFGLWFST